MIKKKWKFCLTKSTGMGVPTPAPWKTVSGTWQRYIIKNETIKSVF